MHFVSELVATFKHRGIRWVPLCLVKSNGTRSRWKQNGPVERFARPGSESSPGAQRGVQAAVCRSLFNTPYVLYTKTANKPKTPFLPLSVDQLIRQSPKYAIQSTPDIWGLLNPARLGAFETVESPPVFRDFPPCLPIGLRKRRNLTEKMRKRKDIFDDD